MKMSETKKRKYEKKLESKLVENKEFLIDWLKKEWEAEQYAAKKEHLVNLAKDSSIAVGKILLTLLAIGGTLAIAAVAPNIFGAVGRSARRRVFLNKKGFQRDKNYLKRLGYVEFERQKDDNWELRLTEKGMNFCLRQSLNEIKLEKPRQWDGFWRIVIFDIPNKHKWAREGFRDRLKYIGFFQLQKSVFVVPYPCEKEVAFLISVFNLSPYARFIKTQYLTNDFYLKKYFKI